ncbi:MAG: hypothetical protein RL684_3108 [Pseudomonadota bacterium]|jgi:2-amino-4-hydroxy-6-hydroxymethyldihydropteridine diphosphokinase
MTAAWIAIGGNIEPARRLPHAAQLLKLQFPDIRFSPVYRNAAEGFTGDDFYNAVAGFETALPIGPLRVALQAIEEACGRGRADAKWAPRAMDIDLLLYGSHVGPSEAGELPRRDLLRRAYMLGPLAALAPALLHPQVGRTIGELWAEQSSPTHARRPHPLERLALDLDVA